MRRIATNLAIGFVLGFLLYTANTRRVRRWLSERYGIHWSVFNDNEQHVGRRDRVTIVKGPAWQDGRFHLWLPRIPMAGCSRTEVSAEWRFFTTRNTSLTLSCNVGHGDGDDGLLLHFAFPWLCSLFLGIEGFRIFRLGGSWEESERHSELRVELRDELGKGLWWSVWQPTMSWSSSTPKWRHGHWDPIDWLLGRPVYSRGVIDVFDAVVTMPEGSYPAKVTTSWAKWERPRWPFPVVRYYSECEVEQGVPHPGKGENSWDCGEDATMSVTAEGLSVAAAVGKMAASVLRDRERYGGSIDWRPQPRTVPS